VITSIVDEDEACHLLRLSAPPMKPPVGKMTEASAMGESSKAHNLGVGRLSALELRVTDERDKVRGGHVPSAAKGKVLPSSMEGGVVPSTKNSGLAEVATLSPGALSNRRQALLADVPPSPETLSRAARALAW